MTIISRLRLDDLKKQYSDPLLSVLTVLLVLMMFVVAPLQAAGVYILGIELFGLGVGLVMVAAALVISASPTTTAIMLAGFSLNIVVVVARLVKPLAYDLYLVAAAWFIIVITLGFAVVRRVFCPGRINFVRILGGVLFCLFLVLLFVYLFMCFLFF